MTNRADWTDTDWVDVATWGMCPCGRPRRRYTEQRDGQPFTSARCDAGHEIGYPEEP